MELLTIKNGKLYKGTEPYLLRGFGLGGWLLPEGYMWKLFTKCDRPRRIEAMIETLCGTEYASKFWDSYYETYITEQDIAWISENGFNSVRLALNARHLCHAAAEGLAFDRKTIGYVDLLIEWCKAYGIYVILDVHGAPGGQTGQNIDDSEDDQPRLFMEDRYQQELIELWAMLANRYKDEPAVAAYDLMNEPLPNWFSQYNDLLMPLYQTLIATIREIDPKHVIILEGLHWATDFSVFDVLGPKDVADNIMLEFHKYWSHPDQESLVPFIESAQRLKAPLFMGEGGENNLDWYTTVFPLYERLDISWSFWTYKKMDCDNSPISFKRPAKWASILEWIDGERELSRGEAIAIFDDLLFNIAHSEQNLPVIHALNRRVPVNIPAEAYDVFSANPKKERIRGADIRLSDPIDIVFETGRIGNVDYKRYGGEPQPVEENLLVALDEGESIGFLFRSDDEIIGVKIQCAGDAMLICEVDGRAKSFEVRGRRVCEWMVKTNQNLGCEHDHQLNLICENGKVMIDAILLKRGE